MSDSKLSLTPLGDRVVIEPASSEEVTESGIVLPDTASKERPEQGAVVAVGPGKRNPHTGKVEPLAVRVGDTVLFRKYGPDEFEVDGTEYLIAREDDILAVIS